MNNSNTYTDNGNYVNEVKKIQGYYDTLIKTATECGEYIKSLIADGTANEMDVYTLDYICNVVCYRSEEKIGSALNGAERSLFKAKHYDDIDADELEEMECDGELDEYRARFD